MNTLEDKQIFLKLIPNISSLMIYKKSKTRKQNPHSNNKNNRFKNKMS